MDSGFQLGPADRRHWYDKKNPRARRESRAGVFCIPPPKATAHTGQPSLQPQLYSMGRGNRSFPWLSRPRMVMLPTPASPRSCTSLVNPNSANTFKNNLFIKFLVYLPVSFVSCQNLDWCKANNNNHCGVIAEFCHQKSKMTRSTSYWHGSGPKELRASKSLLLE